MFPKYRTNSTLPQKVVTEAAAALNTVKAAAIGQCPCTDRRASTRVYSRVLWRPPRQTGEAWSARRLCSMGVRLLVWDGLVADWDVLCTLKIEVLWVTGGLLPSPTDNASVREKKSSWIPHPCISYKSFSSIVILGDCCRREGLSLTQNVVMITLVFPVHTYLGQSLIYELGHFMDRRFVLMVYLSNLSFWFFPFLIWELSPFHLKEVLCGFSSAYSWAWGLYEVK